jgi:hypothetical protein
MSVRYSQLEVRVRKVISLRAASGASARSPGRLLLGQFAPLTFHSGEQAPLKDLHATSKSELRHSSYLGEGAGREPINVVMGPESINRDGNIVHVYVGRDFTEVDGEWTPGLGWFVVSYDIDCKFHTYYELWFETDRGFQNLEKKWITIEPESEVAFAEKRVCSKPAPNKHPHG